MSQCLPQSVQVMQRCLLSCTADNVRMDSVRQRRHSKNKMPWGHSLTLMNVWVLSCKMRPSPSSVETTFSHSPETTVLIEGIKATIPAITDCNGLFLLQTAQAMGSESESHYKIMILDKDSGSICKCMQFSHTADKLSHSLFLIQFSSLHIQICIHMCMPSRTHHTHQKIKCPLHTRTMERRWKDILIPIINRRQNTTKDSAIHLYTKSTQIHWFWRY